WLACVTSACSYTTPAIGCAGSRRSPLTTAPTFPSRSSAASPATTEVPRKPFPPVTYTRGSAWCGSVNETPLLRAHLLARGAPGPEGREHQACDDVPDPPPASNDCHAAQPVEEREDEAEPQTGVA